MPRAVPSLFSACVPTKISCETPPKTKFDDTISQPIDCKNIGLSTESHISSDQERKQKEDEMAYEKGPDPVDRIPKSNYTKKFLQDLIARGEVLEVDEGWDEKKTPPPSHISWVIYPNGDLMQIKKF